MATCGALVTRIIKHAIRWRTQANFEQFSASIKIKIKGDEITILLILSIDGFFLWQII